MVLVRHGSRYNAGNSLLRRNPRRTMKLSGTNTDWPPPPARLTLQHEEIHIWTADVGVDAGGNDRRDDDRVEAHAAVLSADERARAERFRFAKDRRRFLVRRAVLRNILSRYRNVAPAQLRFHYDSHGKPSLTGETGGDSLSFSMSHSHGIAVYAVATAATLGIDVERRRPVDGTMEIARRFFAPREVETLDRLEGWERADAFLALWTCKEAYVKATGHGLSTPLDRIEILLGNAPDAQLLAIDGDRGKASQWTLWRFSPRPAFTGAIAVLGHDWQLRFYRHAT